MRVALLPRVAELGDGVSGLQLGDNDSQQALPFRPRANDEQPRGRLDER